MGKTSGLSSKPRVCLTLLLWSHLGRRSLHWLTVAGLVFGLLSGTGPGPWSSKSVPKYEYFAKAKLASYQNEDGRCLHLQEQDEKSFFDLSSIVKGRRGGNEELCRRMGMGIALDAAAAASGVNILNKHFSGEWPEGVVNLLRKLNPDCQKSRQRWAAWAGVSRTCRNVRMPCNGSDSPCMAVNYVSTASVFEYGAAFVQVPHAPNELTGLYGSLTLACLASIIGLGKAFSSSYQVRCYRRFRAHQT